jgi:hypothetical protein
MLNTAMKKTVANGGLPNGTIFGPKIWSSEARFSIARDDMI